MARARRCSSGTSSRRRSSLAPPTQLHRASKAQNIGSTVAGLGCPAGRTMAFTEHQPELSRFASDETDVAIVEDHQLFREGLVELLGGADPSIRVVATFESAEQAVEVIPRVMPDVVLMDIHL